MIDSPPANSPLQLCTLGVHVLSCRDETVLVFEAAPADFRAVSLICAQGLVLMGFGAP